MRRRFFVEKFEAGAARLGGEGAEHLGRVLRAQRGQLYELSDGREVWLARVERASKISVEFSLVEPIPARVARLHSTLLLGIVKYDRFEWCLEKATELGVNEIVPLLADRSENGLVAAAPKRADRWRRILLESAQQARRLAPPVLAQPRPTSEAVAQVPQGALCILLSERAAAPLMRSVMNGVDHAQHAALAIGPEGGWSEGECAAFATAGFREASLGSNILRTETAVIAALASLNYALGEDS